MKDVISLMVFIGLCGLSVAFIGALLTAAIFTLMFASWWIAIIVCSGAVGIASLAAAYVLDEVFG